MCAFATIHNIYVHSTTIAYKHNLHNYRRSDVRPQFNVIGQHRHENCFTMVVSKRDDKRNQKPNGIFVCLRRENKNSRSDLLNHAREPGVFSESTTVVHFTPFAIVGKLPSVVHGGNSAGSCHGHGHACSRSRGSFEMHVVFSDEVDGVELRDEEAKQGDGGVQYETERQQRRLMVRVKDREIRRQEDGPQKSRCQDGHENIARLVEIFWQGPEKKTGCTERGSGLDNSNKGVVCNLRTLSGGFSSLKYVLKVCTFSYVQQLQPPYRVKNAFPAHKRTRSRLKLRGISSARIGWSQCSSTSFWVGTGMLSSARAGCRSTLIRVRIT